MYKYKEANFSLSYRAHEVRQIMDALTHRRSIGVFGLAGMGKSNVLRFLVSHPEIKKQYLGADAAHFLFVMVDCNLGDARTEQGMLAELDMQLERAGLMLPMSLTLSPSSALRQSVRLRLEALDAAQSVVIFFDPVDAAFENLSPQFWTYLRGLRDLQGNVSYVFGARRPPPPLRELQELLTEACWVPPLSDVDALASLARDANRLAVKFSSQEQTLLLTLSGGHPGFLKNCAELLARCEIRTGMTISEASRIVLASETLQEACRDLWAGLEPEWQTLRQICLHIKPADFKPEAISLAELSGVIRQRAEGYEIFSPLLSAYIVLMMPRVLRVRVRPSGAAQMEGGQGTHSFKIGEGGYQLLRALVQAPAHVSTRTQLAQLLYAGDPHYSDEAVMAHVKRLRKILNTALRPHIDDPTFNAVLSERNVGYRLNVQTESGWTIEYQLSN